jgi:beta-lactamase regulating signal transducer with metallopeptidase domain
MNSFWTMFEAALAQSLVAALWQGALLGATAALVLSAMWQRSASARHLVGLLFLLAMLIAPVWHLVATLRAPMDEALAATGAAPMHWAGPALPWVGNTASSWHAPSWLAWLWCGGVLVMLARLGTSWWWLRTLEQQPMLAAVPLAWQRRAERLRIALGIHRPVTLRLLPGEASPFTARAWRPVVWLPVTLLTKLAPEQIEALIAHELAHVRRLDWLWNGLQCTIEMLLFFHPAVWWLSRQVRIERELACDRLAARVCGDTVVVAEALAALGEAATTAPVPTLAQAAHSGSLQQRVAHLLAAEHPAPPRWGITAVLAAALCGGGVWAAQTQAASTTTATPPVPAAPARPGVATEDPWWTTVGDSIRIRISEKGQMRDYHAWTSPNGEKHETYRVDGRPAEVTAEVRAWAQAHHHVPMPPAPPPSPDAPEPDLPDEYDGPLPPLPPAPPEPPKISETAAYQAMLAAVQQDAGAVQRLGSPIQPMIAAPAGSTTTARR